MYGVKDLFKIGIGPSSSHTMGPMLAANHCVNTLKKANKLSQICKIQVTLYGSLSATGQGHFTDRAILAGLMGFDAESIDESIFNTIIEDTNQHQKLTLCCQQDCAQTIAFNLKTDLQLNRKFLAHHPNALTIDVFDNATKIHSETYYSIGGGSIEVHSQLNTANKQSTLKYPLPFDSAKTLLSLCRQHKLTISELVQQNELATQTEADLRQFCLKIWSVMGQTIERGLNASGYLAGGLQVKKRAQVLFQKIQSKQNNLITSTAEAFDWLNVYAIAVNEENASGHRIVTAPTNGAAGVVPAVLAYCVNHLNITEQQIITFLLTATAIGSLCKTNASISGAEVGCQGEVGSASAMAAAGIASVIGCNSEQIENAAEIALEHNLGLTCDPIGGLVQIPCIERNALAAVKSVNAANLAHRGDGSHIVSLDRVIKTMYETGLDMKSKYKETSKGGLAVNWVEC